MYDKLSWVILAFMSVFYFTKDLHGIDACIIFLIEVILAHIVYALQILKIFQKGG